MSALYRTLERLLIAISLLLMVGLTTLVVVAVAYRKLGASLSWYDEIAAIMLAWLTYYGAALAALKRAHIGFDGLVLSLPVRLRIPAVLLAEVFVIGFFLVLTWTGWQVVQVLEGSSLISLTWVSQQITQSVIPIGGALFILAELVSLPAYLRQVRDGTMEGHHEIPPEVGITDSSEDPKARREKSSNGEGDR